MQNPPSHGLFAFTSSYMKLIFDWHVGNFGFSSTLQMFYISYQNIFTEFPKSVADEQSTAVERRWKVKNTDLSKSSHSRPEVWIKVSSQSNVKRAYVWER